MKEVVGFIGCYSHDVILMLAKVFCRMDLKVLLWDRNRLKTLQASVPIPEGLNASKMQIGYDGLLFTSGETEADKDSDIVLIDFGMEADRKETSECTVLIVVTDMLLHHIRPLAEAEFSKELVKICVIRDTTEGLCKREKEVLAFLQSFPNRREFFLPPDFRDIKNRYVCETTHEYNVRNASPDMQDVIYRIAGMICNGYTEKEIRRQIKYTERRLLK